MIQYRWFKNDRELVHLARCQEWIKKMKDGFLAQEDYRGYPTLPECWLEIMEIYDNCPHEDEKRMILFTITNELTEVLRHWKVDKDNLHGNGKWNKFYYR